MGMCKGCKEVFSALYMKDGYCKSCYEIENGEPMPIEIERDEPIFIEKKVNETINDSNIKKFFSFLINNWFKVSVIVILLHIAITLDEINSNIIYYGNNSYELNKILDILNYISEQIRSK